MSRFIFKKTITSILAFCIVYVLLYFFINGIVGIPIQRGSEFASDDSWQEELRRLGLNKPLIERFWTYTTNIFKGDFGTIYSSTQYGIAPTFFEWILNSMYIILPSFLLGVLIGTIFGYWAAYRNNKVDGLIISGVAMLFVASPIFVFACYTLLLAPLMNLSTTFIPPTNDGNIINSIKTMILPILVVTLFSSSYWTIYTKKDVVKAIGLDFVESARALGLSEWKIFKSYLFKNTISNHIKLILPLFLLTLGSSVIIENMFAIHGLSALLAFSIEMKEVDIILFSSYFFLLVGIVANLIFSILHMWSNPLLMRSIKTQKNSFQKWNAKKARIQNEIHDYALQLQTSLGGNNA